MTMTMTMQNDAGGIRGVPGATGAPASEACRERLSALADGELDAADCLAACDGWKGDAAQRRDWHAWHVIGDVLRSDELAGCHGDARFVQALRARLEAEPVVLAPAPLAAAAHRERRWAVPAAVAAGFALVVGAFTVTRPVGDAPAAVPLAQGGAAPATVTVAATPAPATAATPEVRVAETRMVRDPRLDAYLAAHKQFAGTTALAIPTASLRAAPADAPRR
jgi:sigma-E factor negative regulatory protein RseA